EAVLEYPDRHRRSKCGHPLLLWRMYHAPEGTDNHHPGMRLKNAGGSGEPIVSLVGQHGPWPRSRVLPAIQNQPSVYDYVLDSRGVLVRLLVSGVIHDCGGVEHSYICRSSTPPAQQASRPLLLANPRWVPWVKRLR